MSDPFSKEIRKYIPWLEYRNLEAHQVSVSLIQSIEISIDAMASRIDLLRQYETSLGFVYFGEKKWLETRLHSQSNTNYSSWVTNELQQTVFPRGFVHETDDHWGKCWKAYTEDLQHFWFPPELLSSIKLEFVEVLILGDEGKFPETEVCHAFEVLHDLHYYLHLAGNKYLHFGDVLLDLLVFWPQQRRWRMYILNDYGSVGGVEFDGQDIVGFR